MKARIPWQGTASQRKAMEDEIKRQILEFDKQFTNDFDAMVLYTLRVHLGFGKKRLRRFWEAFRVEHDKLVEHYQMPGEGAWLADYKLKEIGIDISEWNKEDSR